MTMDPIRYQTSYKLASDQIRRAIKLGTYLPGDRLPPSRELADQLGVSLGTLREAVRGLVREGILEIRRGSQGGLVVLPREPTASQIQTLEMALAEIDQVFELRRAVEGEAARLAAQRRTAEELDRLQRAYEAMSADFDRAAGGPLSAHFNRADSEFHLAIAEASGNQLFRTIIEGTRTRMLSTIGATVRSITFDANRGHSAHAGHMEILRAIRRGQPEAAARAARKHIDITRDDIRQTVSPGS